MPKTGERPPLSNSVLRLALASLLAGRLDIVSANIGEPNRVHFGVREGGFLEGPEFGADAATYAPALADLGRDGDPDIAVANSGSRNRVFLNRAADPSPR